MIRPDNLTLSEWQVVNKGTERISTPGGGIEAVKVKVSLGGFLSAFWSAECWYRVSDGRFVKYSGPSGGPGSPEVTTVLKREDQG